MARGQKNIAEEAEEEKMEAEKPGMRGTEEKEPKRMEGAERKHGGRMKRARGGRMDAAEEHKMGKHSPAHHPRKRGGKVPGKAPKSRPDRRARGGATADMNPTTAAGKMSVPDYEHKATVPDGGGRGGDNAGKNGRD